MALEKSNNKIKKIIDESIKNVGSLIDVNTIIGKPITIECGEIIIPISKITFGVLAGAGEYGKISIFKKGEDLPFTAGNGSVISIKPCGFLIKDSLTKTYKFVSTSETSYDKIIDKTSEFFENLRVEQ